MGCLQVSAGYDAHWRDPLATLQMRSSTYYRLSARIKALADELAGTQAICLHYFLNQCIYVQLFLK